MRRWFYYVNWLPLHNATANPRMVSELRPGRKFCDRLCFLALCCLATCSEEEGCFVGAVGHCKMFDVVSVRARSAVSKLWAKYLTIGQVLVSEEGLHSRGRVLWCRRFRSNCHGSASEVPDSHLKGGSEISISMPFFNPKLRKDGRKMSCWIMRRWFYYVNWLSLHNVTANPGGTQWATARGKILW